MVVCKKCGTELNDDAVRCPKCWTRVGETVAQPEEERTAVFCMKCGAKMWVGARFCQKCGNRMELPVPEPVPETEAPQPSAPFSPIQTPPLQPDAPEITEEDIREAEDWISAFTGAEMNTAAEQSAEGAEETPAPEMPEEEQEQEENAETAPAADLWNEPDEPAAEAPEAAPEQPESVTGAETAPVCVDHMRMPIEDAYPAGKPGEEGTGGMTVSGCMTGCVVRGDIVVLCDETAQPIRNYLVTAIEYNGTRFRCVAAEDGPRPVLLTLQVPEDADTAAFCGKILQRI